jgi:hypothetical protein
VKQPAWLLRQFKAGVKNHIAVLEEVKPNVIDLAILETGFVREYSFRQQATTLVLRKGSGGAFWPAPRTLPIILAWVKLELARHNRTDLWSVEICHQFLAYLHADASPLQPDEVIQSEAAQKRCEDLKDPIGTAIRTLVTQRAEATKSHHKPKPQFDKYFKH